MHRARRKAQKLDGIKISFCFHFLRSWTRNDLHVIFPVMLSRLPYQAGYNLKVAPGNDCKIANQCCLVQYDGICIAAERHYLLCESTI